MNGSTALVLSAVVWLHPVGDFGGGTDGEGSFTVEAVESGEVSVGTEPVSASDGVTDVQYVRGVVCANSVGTFSLEACGGVYTNGGYTCPDGSDEIPPLWRRDLQADGSWSAWVQVAPGYCATDTAAFQAALANEWASLTPAAPAIQTQPPAGSAHIGTIPTIGYVVPATRTHTATLAGVDVILRATATEYVWDWGDGRTTTTTDPGAPYPNATVSHAFGAIDRTVTIVLTTVWAGEFSVDGGTTWTSIAGTITTSPAPVSFTVQSVHTRLTDCDENGKNCASG